MPRWHVPVVGLTGGIGSGKSTVASLFADRGAVLIDADLISREVMAPGGAAYQPVVDRFGPGVLNEDGTIDRAAVARIVFNDAEALADLNGITHPAIGRVMAERLAEAAADPERVVVLDIPLLAEGAAAAAAGDDEERRAAARSRYGIAAVVVVDTPPETALARLVGQRGMDEDDARARIANQATRETRLALADVVIDNSGTREHLEAEVDRAWREIRALAV